MTSFDHRRASRLPLNTHQLVHVEAYIRPVDDADILEVKWLCTQPALKTVVIAERYPWHQRISDDAGPPNEPYAEAWGLGVIGAFVALFGA